MSDTKLVSSFAQFVQGDIKGGAHAHAYRISVIRAAIEQAFKGNYSPITEAKTLTEGKAKKARAYHAGFATFGPDGLSKVAYIGKLNDNANKPARELIESSTHNACAAFFVAFDAVMAEKPAPKAKTAPAPATEAPATEAPATEAAPAGDDDSARHNAAVAQDNAVLTIVNMLNQGMLTGEQFDAIDDAVRAYKVAQVAALAMAEKNAVAMAETGEPCIEQQIANALTYA